MTSSDYSLIGALMTYDPWSGNLHWRKRASSRRDAGSIAGCQSKANGYVEVRVGGKLYKAHRLAWLLMHGTWPTLYLDHINGNRADNRLVNLRECTAAENQQNRTAKGICWDKQHLKWRARIVVGGARVLLGLFVNKDEALNAYKEAKRTLHTFNPEVRNG